MDESSESNESLIARIQQLERERDELHKDIEQLCMQQAGPGYLGVATRMHFQRTAGLEQEIESLKKKLAAGARENLDLREELSEAYRIKGQLAELHSTEVAKNSEAEKQIKFFQGSVAAAFAERDNAVMEAEKAKEKEELMSRQLNSEKIRVEELMSELLEEKELAGNLRINLERQERENELFRKVVDKFFDIRQDNTTDSEDMSYEDKCEHLLRDSTDMWSFHDCDEETSTPNYVNALQEEVEKLKSSVDYLQYQLRVGVQIESHLQKMVRDLEKEIVILKQQIRKGILSLHECHSQHRIDITNILDEGYAFMKSTIDTVEEKISQFEIGSVQESRSPESEHQELPQNECRDVHISPDASLDSIAKTELPALLTRCTPETGDASAALSQALQEKVSALLLLSQQEERHLLERNVHAALQKKIEELQRNFLQVTNEKVKVLVELAQLKQEYQSLKEKVSGEMKQGHPLAESGEKSTVQERDGRLRNLLKNTYLKRWVGPGGSDESNAEAHLSSEGKFTPKKSNYDIDYARLRIENATLKESLASMEHLTSSIRRLHLSLLKVKESATAEDTNTSLSAALNSVISEAKLLRTALGSSLPVSWSADPDVGVSSDHCQEELKENGVETSGEKVDFVSAAGLQMVELLMFAAQILKHDVNHQGGQADTDSELSSAASTTLRDASCC